MMPVLLRRTRVPLAGAAAADLAGRHTSRRCRVRAECAAADS